MKSATIPRLQLEERNVIDTMKSMAEQLTRLFGDALVRVLGEDGRSVDPMIRVAGDEKFGDYQSNVAMSLAKRLGKKPGDVAGEIDPCG